ncbi:MAG: GGDEF domain-containing protein [Gallionella sp.]|nr:GGDEF domain-containing protein [Gallionella sp.]
MLDDVAINRKAELASALAQRAARRASAPASKQRGDGMLAHLNEIIGQRLLTVLFQPVADLRSGAVFGYEGFIRGPSDSPLHSPINLFNVAARYGLMVEIEHLCRRVVLERFTELGLPGKLFLNVNPQSLIQGDARHGKTLNYLQDVHLSPTRVVVELTESLPTYDFEVFYQAATHYREMGFQVAMDGFAEGFSSQHLCSELHPEFVKIDLHLIQDISNNPVKQHFVRSIREIAEKTGCQVIAEGIETQRDLLLLRDLGIAFGQGYHIARPNAHPATALSAEVAKTLIRNSISSNREPLGSIAVTAEKLLHHVAAVSPDTHNATVFEKFNADLELYAIPVVKNNIPVGMINRQAMIEHMARPYRQELSGKKPCSKFMDTAPLIVDKNISIQELSALIVEGERHHLINGFIITEDGYYRGMGTGHDLVREITQMQIAAARQANPLTQLPGNIPINERIGSLLESGTIFYACYCDLDHFKPFNDVYGFHKGDEVIMLTAGVMIEFCDPVQDFIGHVGGDDFIVLFRSEDWEERCKNILKAFGERILEFFSIEDRERGGYVTEDRQGKRTFQPLTSLSLGVAKIFPEEFSSLHQVSAMATTTKKQAKKMPGNSLFIERREHQIAANGKLSEHTSGDI